MSCCLRAPLLLLVLVFVSVSPVSGWAETNPSVDANGAREDFHDQSIVTESGWTLVTKPSFWPLCYESANRFDAVMQQLDGGDRLTLARDLERVATWLRMSQQCGLSDAASGIGGVITSLTEVSHAMREGKTTGAQQRIRDVIVDGYLCIAKSHLIRASEFDNNWIAPPPRSSDYSRSPLARVLREIEFEIEAERVARGLLQYRYDTVETHRHYQVALFYFREASKLRELPVDSEALIDVVLPQNLGHRESLSNFVTCDLRPAVRYLSEAVDTAKAQGARFVLAADSH